MENYNLQINPMTDLNLGPFDGQINLVLFS